MGTEPASDPGSARGLRPFRRPRSVAVVGASPRPGSPGGTVLDGFLDGGFRGAVWPVNPRHGRIRGRRCFPSLAALPAAPDLAVLLVPAEACPGVVREARALGVPAVVVSASGFAEAGPRGIALQRELVEGAPGGRTRLLGPNCLGVMDPRGAVDTFFVPPASLGRPAAGPVAILSQSGVFALSLVESLSRTGPGLSVAVSYGNRCDLGESDWLDALADDAATRAVALVMESVDDGPRFLRAAARCAARKPVLALKCGRGRAGAEAVRGHTGALAGAAAVYGAAFRAAGVVEVGGLGALADGVRAAALQPPAPGPRILVVTNGGGFGIECADQAEAAGLVLPPLPARAASRLRGTLAPFASLRNPLDVTAVARERDFAAVLREAFLPRTSPYDLALLSCLSTSWESDSGVAAAAASAARRSGRPVVVLHAGGRRGEAAERAFAAAGIPTYPTPERAVEAARILVERGRTAPRRPGTRGRA